MTQLPTRIVPQPPVADFDKHAVNLDKLFEPAAVAIVGASRSTSSIPGRLIPVLLDSGYAGSIYPINPVADSMGELKAFSSLSVLPQRPDVVLIVVKAAEALKVVEEAVRLSIPFIILNSSGFSESPENRKLGDRLRGLLAGSKTRLLGPSSEGLIDTAKTIALGFSPAIDPARRSRVIRSGNAVVLSQSGALGFSLADFLSCNGYGVRSVITTGNEMDLTIADFMEYFSTQDGVGPIVLVLENMTDAPRFVKAALKLKAKGISVLAFRIGSSSAGQRASLSHAGKVTGNAASYSAVFAKASVVELEGIDHFLDSMQMVCKSVDSTGGSRVAVVSGSGGAGIWLADALVAAGLSVPELSDELKSELQSLSSPFASMGNPIDLTAQAVYNGSLSKILDRLMRTSEVDSIALVGGFGYSNWIIRDEAVKSVLLNRTKPVVAFSYNVPSPEALDFFETTGLPFFSDPTRAARAFSWTARKSQSETLPSTSRTTGRVVSAPPKKIDDATIRRLLIKNGVRLNDRTIVNDLADVPRAIASMAFPLVMKIDVPSLIHKSELNAVITDIRDERAAVEAARELFSRASHLGYRSVTIEPHLKGHEAFVAAINDPDVGPMIVLGRGGIYVEIYDDVVHRLLPLDAEDVRQALEKLAIYPVWRDGLRGSPKANLDALVEFTVAFATTITEIGAQGWSEIECNPVIINSEGATAVDVRLVPSS